MCQYDDSCAVTINLGDLLFCVAVFHNAHDNNNKYVMFLTQQGELVTRSNDFLLMYEDLQQVTN